MRSHVKGVVALVAATVAVSLAAAPQAPSHSAARTSRVPRALALLAAEAMDPAIPDEQASNIARAAQYAAVHAPPLNDRDALAPLAAAREAKAAPAAREPALARAWSEVGPRPYHVDDPRYGYEGAGWTTVAGRITSIAVDTTDRTGATLWAGAASGGVWKTTDAGGHWRPMFDDQPTLAVGAVAIDPANHNRVFVGTGEGNDGFAGTGVYRTTNGGHTWQRVAKNLRAASAVFRIEITGRRVFVATTKGLFVSLDGGASYADAKLPTAGDRPTAHFGAFGDYVTDVRIKPGNPQEVTAVVGANFAEYLATSYGEPAAYPAGTGLYRSTAGGAPGTFRRLDAVGFGRPSPEGQAVERVSLAYATGPTQDHNIMWAVMSDTGRVAEQDAYAAASTTGVVYVFRSGDDGMTWEPKADAQSFESAPGSAIAYFPSANGVQGWYNQFVGVDPSNVDRVVVGFEEIYEVLAGANTPGPASWYTIGRYWNYCPINTLTLYNTYFFSPNCNGLPTYEGHTTHPDQHTVAFAGTKDGVRMYVGNDGGVYAQDAHDTAPGRPSGYDNEHWRSIGSSLGIAQAYYATQGGDGTVYAGTQDNGTFRIGPGSRRGDMVLGGDGFDVAVDPTDSDVAYNEVYFAAIAVTVDGGRSARNIAPSNIVAPLFSTPFELDERDPQRLIVGGQNILETDDGDRTTSDTWKQVLDLGTTTDGQPNRVTALDVRGAPAYAAFCSHCYAGFQGHPQVFRSGIATNVRKGCRPEAVAKDCWHKAAARGLPARWVTDVAIDPRNPRTVFATVGGYVYGLTDAYPPRGGHVYVSHDAGESFQNISGNLPNTPADAITLRGNRLYVGTDVGVFTAGPRGGHFERLGRGLPNAYVQDVNVDPTGRYLVAGTFGRGVWRYDFGEALR
ncbi:MAG: hypothetical protein ABR520_00755 [Mycobacteriales bacterium]|nr:hypothetical protein [Frankia sp.]